MGEKSEDAHCELPGSVGDAHSVCPRAHVCVQEDLLPPGKFLPGQFCWFQAALPDGALLQSQLGNYFGKIIAK